MIREEKRKEELDGGKAFKVFTECKFSIGKNNNDMHGKFREDILIVVY